MNRTLQKKLYTILNDAESSSMGEQIENLRPIHGHNTRFNSTGNLNYPYCRTTLFHNSFLFRCIGIFNSLPENIKASSSCKIFVKRYKDFLYNDHL